MRRVGALLAVLLWAVLPPLAARTAPDCRFQESIAGGSVAAR